MTECVNEVHSRQWTVEIDVNGRSTEFVIDTGASVTLMPRKTWDRSQGRAISQSDIQLH